MEFVNGGELMDLLLGQDGFREDIARFFFKQMIKGISHCHFKGMTHRDLKPENMLVQDYTKLKLCDFGFAKKATGSEMDGLTSTYIGTTAYMDPEIYAGHRYDPIKADVWSLGIILFICIFGNFPIQEPSKKSCSFFNAISKGSWDQFWKAHEQQKEDPVSEELKDLLSMMMQPNKNLRLTLADVIAHPWMAGSTASEGEVQADVMHRMEVAKENADEPEACERYNNEAHRDFKLCGVTYYAEFKNEEIANKDNAVYLPVVNYDSKIHNYRHKKKCTFSPDEVFSQLRSFLNNQGVRDEDMEVCKESWRLEFKAVDGKNATEKADSDEEEVKREDERLPNHPEEFCKMVCEILGEDTESRYLYAKRIKGSAKLFSRIWEQLTANIKLMD